jgi:D-serine deaminase-like pyridoxal phosphate-dependent protein
VQQSIIGSCDRSEVAMFVLTHVIGHYPERNQLLLDAGFTALSNQGAGLQHEVVSW